MKKKLINKKCPVINLALLLLAFQNGVEANPSGAEVINGEVSIDRSVENVMAITNSPNAIINWNNFNISQNEITRFIQQNSQSAVLNQVIGENPSEILGQLISNGQVFLINPNGIIFGADSMIDTQGMIASTLNMSNEDFLNGNYHFIANSEVGGIVNEGIIRAGDQGNIILIAPDITNKGTISTEGGQITLAAGSELTLTNLETPEIQFQIQAPEHKVLNIGEIITQGGAIDVFASSITHSGKLNANSVEIDKQGTIKLLALDHVNVSGQSLTTANNPKGKGGSIQITADTISIMGNSYINADGDTGGGEILIKGDSQKIPDVHNASTVTIDPRVYISANAELDNEGGKITIQSDNDMQIKGYIAATGGKNSGNGGFIDVSAKQHLLIDARVDLTADNGKTGELLLNSGTIQLVAKTPPYELLDVFINGIQKPDFLIEADRIVTINADLNLNSGQLLSLNNVVFPSNPIDIHEPESGIIVENITQAIDGSGMDRRPVEISSNPIDNASSDSINTSPYLIDTLLSRPKRRPQSDWSTDLEPDISDLINNDDVQSVDPVAKVSFMRGRVIAISVGKKPRLLEKDSSIYQNETIQTEKGSSASILFNDGTKIIVEPNSRFRMGEHNNHQQDK